MFWTIVGALLFFFIGIPFILGLIGLIFTGIGNVFWFVVEGIYKLSTKKTVPKSKDEVILDDVVDQELDEEDGEYEIVFAPEYKKEVENDEE